MAATAIEWTDDSWNPLRARDRATGKVGWHCVHASDGCRHCYAEPINRRFGTVHPYAAQSTARVETFLDEAVLAQPLRWRKPRKAFPCSMTDIAGDWVTDAQLDRMFAVMALTPHVDWQIATKRPDRLRAYLATPWTAQRIAEAAEAIISPQILATPNGPDYLRLVTAAVQIDYRGSTDDPPRPQGLMRWPLPNVWVGCSAEDQRCADARRPAMAAIAAAGWTTWVSYEPALGPVDWTGWAFLRWLVAGGESGPKARPMHPAWARAARDWCATHAIAFFFKQWGAWAPRGAWKNHSTPADVEAARGGGQPDVAWPDGTIAWGTYAEHGGPGMSLDRVGKAKAGRLLDGVEHSAFPAVLARAA